MTTTIIRRIPRNQIIKNNKRELAQTYKTGIHTNEIVNEAISKIDQESRGSGNGTAPASTTIPLLLKIQRAQSAQGKDQHEGKD